MLDGNRQAPPEDYIPLQEAARRSRGIISYPTLYSWVRQGIFRTVQAGGRGKQHYVLWSEVEDALRARYRDQLEAIGLNQEARK